VHTNKPEKQPLDNFKISEHKSEMQDTNYKAKEQIFERTKSMLDDALNEIKDKNVEIERLKAKLSTATFSAEQDKDIARDYRLLKDQKEDLERKYIDLSETPFIKNPNGQVMANRVKDLESENIQLKGKYEEMKDDLIKKEIERGKFEDKYNTVEQEKTHERSNDGIHHCDADERPGDAPQHAEKPDQGHHGIDDQQGVAEGIEGEVAHVFANPLVGVVDALGSAQPVVGAVVEVAFDQMLRHPFAP
jgi:hypothetical protein